MSPKASKRNEVEEEAKSPEEEVCDALDSKLKISETSNEESKEEMKEEVKEEVERVSKT